jgi:transposase-like protein
VKRSSTQNRPVLGRRSAREKTTLLNQYRDSGLSLLTFARKHQLCYSTLIRWRKRFGQHAQSQSAPKVAPSPKFIPIHLEPEPAPGALYILGLSRGRSLKIPPGFETESLRRLLTVLEGGQ